MEIQLVVPALNIVGSVIFFAFFKPKIEQWQLGRVRMEDARKKFLSEIKALVDVVSSNSKRLQLGQLISMTVEVEREMVRRFYRLVSIFATITALAIWLDSTTYIFFQAGGFQWIFHVNTLMNLGLTIYLLSRAHGLDNELSDFEKEIVLSYCARTHYELVKS